MKNITTARLGELTKQGIVTKTEGNYKITTKAIIQLQKEMLPKVLSKALQTQN